MCMTASSVCVEEKKSVILTAEEVVGTGVSAVFLTTQTKAAPALPVLGSVEPSV